LAPPTRRERTSIRGLTFSTACLKTLRWLVQAANQRPERRAAVRIAHELMDAAEGKGGAVKKKEDVERMAEANRAYAHYRW